MICVRIGCTYQAVTGTPICAVCAYTDQLKGALKEAKMKPTDPLNEHARRRSDGEQIMSKLYPKYYKRIPEGVTEIDTYLVNMLFPVDDASGAILHARKKLLVPGTRTGGKSMWDDIKEARDTLNRWLELNPPLQHGIMSKSQPKEQAEVIKGDPPEMDQAEIDAMNAANRQMMNAVLGRQAE